MRGLQFVQFGLFLILLGFSVMLFAILCCLVGVSMMLAGSLGGGGKLMAIGVISLLFGALPGALGKLLCLGAPETGARNLIVASVICDFIVFGIRVADSDSLGGAIVALVVVWIAAGISYLCFLRFLTRMGENVGEPRVGEYVAIIYGGIGGGFLVPVLFAVSWQIAVLAICVLGLITTFLYNYTIYTLHRALPLYLDEVRMGLTDPRESGAERLARERKDRLKGPGGGGGPSPSKPPEEPVGPPPVGHQLYRIPKALEPLHKAVKEGDRFKVETRLAHGDNPTTPVKHGLTPLHIAASVGVMDVADCLLKAGARVDDVCEEGLTPLYFAIQTGNPNIVGLLVNKGANLFHRNSHGYTPLHWACCAPHPNFVGPVRVKMVNQLLSQGADVLAQTNDGKTARDLALENQLEEVISALDRHMGVSSGPGSSFQQNSSGSSSAEDEGAAPPPFKPFLGTHLMVMPKDLPVLHAAVKEGDPEKIKRLVIEGHSMTEAIPGGISPIHITSITGVMSGTDLLLSLGAGVNDSSDHGLTPVFMSVYLNNVNMIGYLVSRGANINHQDDMGRTPLHWAAAVDSERLVGQNRLKMVEFLLQHGAFPGVEDHDGQTPRDLARAAGQEDVERILCTGDEESGGGAGDDDDYYV